LEKVSHLKDGNFIYFYKRCSRLQQTPEYRSLSEMMGWKQLAKLSSFTFVELTNTLSIIFNIIIGICGHGENDIYQNSNGQKSQVFLSNISKIDRQK
jgi:hypothetical protein